MGKTLVWVVSIIANSLSIILLASADPTSDRSPRNIWVPATESRLEIQAAEVTFAGDEPATLFVKGSNFGTEPAVLTLGDIDLSDYITLWTDTMIEADLLSYSIPPATYLVKVHIGVALVFRDEIDVTFGAAGPRGPIGPKGDPGPPGATPFVGMSCPEGEVLIGIDANAMLICEPISALPTTRNTVTANANPAAILLGTLPRATSCSNNLSAAYRESPQRCAMQWARLSPTRMSGSARRRGSCSRAGSGSRSRQATFPFSPIL